MILSYSPKLRRFSVNGKNPFPKTSSWVHLSFNISDKLATKFVVKCERHFKFPLPELAVVRAEFAKFIECQKS